MDKVLYKKISIGYKDIYSIIYVVENYIGREINRMMDQSLHRICTELK